MKKIAQRKCMGCNEIKDKNVLIRIVKNKENNIFVDKFGKQDGRGAYICDNIDCLENAIKKRSFERSFKQKIDLKIFENIRGVIVDR